MDQVLRLNAENPVQTLHHVARRSIPLGGVTRQLNSQLFVFFALCKLHNAAFDRQFIGIRPDYKVEVQRKILDEMTGLCCCTA